MTCLYVGVSSGQPGKGAFFWNFKIEQLNATYYNEWNYLLGASQGWITNNLTDYAFSCANAYPNLPYPS